jgi:hypothetical protein
MVTAIFGRQGTVPRIQINDSVVQKKIFLKYILSKLRHGYLELLDILSTNVILTSIRSCLVLFVMLSVVANRIAATVCLQRGKALV